MLFDTHMHCEYSCDSKMTLEQAVAEAEKQNIGMIVTEHWDYDYPTNPTEFLFDIDDFYAKQSKLRSDKEQNGKEIGMQPHIAQENDRVAAGHAFDFVLGSIHCMTKKDLYEKTCYAGLTKRAAVRQFLEDAITCVESHQDFDAFAHIDYLTRYWIYEGEYLELADAPELFDKLFNLLIAKGKPLEINTRRLDDEQAVASLLAIYKRYQELGGKYCTLGSDAHYVEHIGRRLDVAMQMARECNLTPVYFKERKMQLIEE